MIMSGRQCSLNSQHSLFETERVGCTGTRSEEWWYSATSLKGKGWIWFLCSPNSMRKLYPLHRWAFHLCYRGKFISWGVTASKHDCIAFKNELLPLQRGVLHPTGFPTWISTCSEASTAKCRFNHRTALEQVLPPAQVGSSRVFSGSHSPYLGELKYCPPQK